MRDLMNQALAEWNQLLPKLLPLAEPLEKLVSAMLDSWQQGGKTLIAGNGGSAADSMHFAEELVVRFRKNRRALPAIALCDPTVITCAGNDFGYESVFERQVEAFGKRGDVLIILSTSGNSTNLIKAIKLAKERGLTTAAFLGKTGGMARGLCDIELIVPSNDTARIQEAHKLFIHILCQYVDDRID
ncbi:MAG TPA: SIS domain-containing protein [Tepidisphaeraceae bacterium]|jgi:D-sedoheptulose 7-phosphate isomerase|nr:SIS domain-containing protein [Tepidisphaeraceae bacterium]